MLSTFGRVAIAPLFCTASETAASPDVLVVWFGATVGAYAFRERDAMGEVGVKDAPEQQPAFSVDSTNAFAQ